MNRLIIIIIFILQTIVVSAQKRKDPSYSVHNYKHPNKAAEAAANNYDDLQEMEYKPEKGARRRNYKAQTHVYSQDGGGVLPQEPMEKTTNSVFSRRNYKRQF